MPEKTWEHVTFVDGKIGRTSVHPYGWELIRLTNKLDCWFNKYKGLILF